jgi:hypothetical protein
MEQARDLVTNLHRALQIARELEITEPTTTDEWRRLYIKAMSCQEATNEARGWAISACVKAGRAASGVGL